MLDEFTFTPEAGLLDDNTYPTDPESESDARAQIQDGMNQIRDYINETLLPAIEEQYAVSSFDSNNYTVLIPGIIAYAEGMTVTFKAASSNTAGSTLNINNLGPKNIYKKVNSALEAGDIIENQIVNVSYDGENFQILNVPGSNENAFNTHLSDDTAHGEVRSFYRTNRDANGVYTTIEWKRADGTLAKQSVLSGGTSPKYTIRTVAYYELDGVTVRTTKTYAEVYDGDELVSEVLQ